MITRTIIALAVALGTTGGALAASKQQLNPHRDGAYQARGTFINTDPDVNVRMDLGRDPANDR